MKSKKRRVIAMDEEYSVCDDCDRMDVWECRFCCAKCIEDYGECPDESCNPMDI